MERSKLSETLSPEDKVKLSPSVVNYNQDLEQVLTTEVMKSMLYNDLFLWLCVSKVYIKKKNSSDFHQHDSWPHIRSDQIWQTTSL